MHGGLCREYRLYRRALGLHKERRPVKRQEFALCNENNKHRDTKLAVILEPYDLAELEDSSGREEAYRVSKT